jgi:hypothetical protein
MKKFLVTANGRVSVELAADLRWNPWNTHSACHIPSLLRFELLRDPTTEEVANGGRNLANMGF